MDESARHNGDEPGAALQAVASLRSPPHLSAREWAERRADAANSRADAAEARADEADLRSEETQRRLVEDVTLFGEADHKIKTGLTIVGGWAQMLEENWGELPEATRRHGVSVMRARCDAMATEAGALLDGLRAEVANHPPPEAAVSIGPVIAAVADAFAGLPPATAVVAVVEGDPVAFVDRRELDEVLFHLVDNAVKYSPNDGRIVLRASVEADRTVIQVMDHGMGLPDGVDIFAPFTRGQSGDHTAEGSGLGLYVVAKLARAMGATIEASDNAHGGSTFTLGLPRHAPGPKAR